ncbi:MAG: aminotransferase class V-fold PLP-dependent enzyme [Oscillospiraceae bacterium]|nr:aminotransferase class V-fold PLP-dependent enzyme [Oscillospiraceae bacterium]
MTVNFDNAATTYPKPAEVRRAVDEAVARYGSAGRGSHPIAARGSEMVYSAREEIGAFFAAEPENVVFTSNCTHALNIAIQGIMKGGGHVIISGLEHNAVFRPVYALAKAGTCRYSIARPGASEEETVSNFASLIRPDTKAIVCTVCSNVTGEILPWKAIGALCREKNLCFIADGAQGCGVLDIKITDGINILCTAGHKGLYGITGTGLLLMDGKYSIPPLLHGGSGSLSGLPEMPPYLPDALEAGTLGLIGVASLRAGVRFVKGKSVARIYAHETALCERFVQCLHGIPEVTVYRREGVLYAPIVSFNVGNVPSEEVAARLGEKGFCLRAGLQCAPLVHKRMGTDEGTVRFSPSVFSRMQDTVRLCDAVREIVGTLV